MASTSVVLPWSTWAMMATLRRRGLAITDPTSVLRRPHDCRRRSLTQARQQLARPLAELLVVDDLLGVDAGIVGARQVVAGDGRVEPRRHHPAAAGGDALLALRDLARLAGLRRVAGADGLDLLEGVLLGALQAAGRLRHHGGDTRPVAQVA